jgi:hypothetical protein
VSKHLIISRQAIHPFFADSLYVFALPALTAFAVLQSRVHEPWARLLSSSMKNDLRYAASDCFETFPFPEPDPRAVIPALEAIGERLYSARATYMVDTNHGLTQTYNQLKDPKCDEARIVALRALHEDLDRAVLEAYGWSDLAVPPFCPNDVDDRRALEPFQNTIVDRLFSLNTERAADEKRLGVTMPNKGKRGATKSMSKAARRVKTPAGSTQSDLFAPVEGDES